MNSKVFVNRSLLMVGISLVLALSLAGSPMAQTGDLESQGTQGVSPPTPAPAAASAQAGKVIASEELSSGVRVDLLELKRSSGGTVTLKFAVVNDTKKDLAIHGIFSNKGSVYDWDVSKVSLLDTPNKKKYLVMTDSENHCVCSRGGADNPKVTGGTRRAFWAKFQAPPEDVTKITVEMPGTPPFEDIPLTQ